MTGKGPHRERVPLILDPAVSEFFASRNISIRRFVTDFLNELCAPIDDDAEQHHAAMSYLRLWEDARGGGSWSA